MSFDSSKYVIVFYPLRPQSEGNISVADANHLRGGLHIVESEKDHNGNMIPDGVPEFDAQDETDIPGSNIRREGLHCYVISTGNTYVLTGGVSDDDWERQDGVSVDLKSLKIAMIGL